MKIALGIPVIFLAIFFIIFFSTPGEEVIAGPVARVDMTETVSILPPGVPAGPLQTPEVPQDPDREAFIGDFWRWVLGEAEIPERMARNIINSVIESPAFIMELLVVLQQAPYTFLLVDKQHALPSDYSPDDLVHLTTGGSLRITRDDLWLRRSAAVSLEEMAAAAAADGVILTAASTYSSYTRQGEIFRWQVNTFGLETAERQSARPGHSQHQLGTAVDFFPIADAFGDTAASRWLVQNASRFGWSLSYPDGYEHITGYRFEPWHYRYVGRDLAVFIDTYFEGIQQFALQFIKVWQEHALL